jgi:hypothetical protein
VARPVLGLTQPPIQRVLVILSSRLKRLESEADRSSSYSAVVKNCGSIDPLIQTYSWLGPPLIYDKDNTLPFYFIMGKILSW